MYDGCGRVGGSGGKGGRGRIHGTDACGRVDGGELIELFGSLIVCSDLVCGGIARFVGNAAAR